MVPTQTDNSAPTFGLPPTPPVGGGGLPPAPPMPPVPPVVGQQGSDFKVEAGSPVVPPVAGQGSDFKVGAPVAPPSFDAGALGSDAVGESVSPTAPSLQGNNFNGLSSEVVEGKDGEVLTDSFGEPIRPEELVVGGGGGEQWSAMTTGGEGVPPGDFGRGSEVNEGTATVTPPGGSSKGSDLAAGGMGVGKTESPPTEGAAGDGVGGGEEKKDKGSNFSGDRGVVFVKNLPLPVTLIICLSVLVLIGLGVYFLWNYQYQQIAELNDVLAKRTTEVDDLRKQLLNLQDSIELSQDGPVFVAADGSFSFYQDIPNLRVSASDNGAVVDYGELVGGEPINGFLMELTMNKTDGQALTEVVDLEMRGRKVTGMENRDKRDEILEDKIGFSYEQVGNDGWKIIYFLQSALGSANYLRVEYTVVGLSQQETDGYNKLVSGILTSLKIYN